MSSLCLVQLFGGDTARGEFPQGPRLGMTGRACVELLEPNLGKYSAVGGAATAWRRRRAAALGGGRGEHAEAVCKSIGNLAF